MGAGSHVPVPWKLSWLPAGARSTRPVARSPQAPCSSRYLARRKRSPGPTLEERTLARCSTPVATSRAITFRPKRLSDGDGQVEIEVVGGPVGDAGRHLVRLEVEAEAGHGDQPPVSGIDDREARVAQPVEVLAVDGVDPHPLVADAQVQLAAPERARPLEVELPQDVRLALPG